MKRKIIITGGAGFIGSNFIRFWCNKYPEDKLFIVDKLTYAGNTKNLKVFIDNSNLQIYKEDITNKNAIEQIIQDNSINHIINFAAESHVDRSILDPHYFVKTNFEGTYNLLNQFTKHWLKNNSPKDWRFVHISTDEVFGSLGIKDNPFNENSCYQPRSPYSATKAGSDHLVMAWFHTYNLPTIISNCSNNYGPFQHPEKFIPKIIINSILGLDIPIYGKGKNIRDWLFVEDHVKALEKIVLKAIPGSQYCIGGGDEINNIELVKKIVKILDSLNINIQGHGSIKYITDRPGHDFRYSIDFDLIRKDLQWEPKVNIDQGLIKTINWYISNKDWWQSQVLN